MFLSRDDMTRPPHLTNRELNPQPIVSYSCSLYHHALFFLRAFSIFWRSLSIFLKAQLFQYEGLKGTEPGQYFLIGREDRGVTVAAYEATVPEKDHGRISTEITY